MGALPVRLVIRDYEFVHPLALGDVGASGLDVTLVRDFKALERVLGDPAVHGGEGSLGRHVQRLARGDKSFVGLPAFVMREFRHRCLYVRRDRPRRDMADLKGARIGMDAWPNTGNTWSRWLLREQGVGIGDARWVVGAIQPGDTPPPAADALPAGVERAPAGRTLSEMLAADELDCLISAWTPPGFGEAGSPIVRLYPDFRAAERAHYRERGIYPAHHLVILRRELVEAHPAAVRAVYDALLRSREHSDRTRRQLHESSAWLLADLEEETQLLGPDYRPYGVAPNRAMIAAFCDEQWVQGLVPRRLDPTEVFADFERLAG